MTSQRTFSAKNKCQFFERGYCTNKKIREDPIPSPIFCIFETQESQQRFCKGYSGPILKWDYVRGKLKEVGVDGVDTTTSQKGSPAQSVRHTTTTAQREMHKYAGEIARNIDAAHILCGNVTSDGEQSGVCNGAIEGCAFLHECGSVKLCYLANYQRLAEVIGK